MKELSIEEKAKAYDEAKARMSRAYNSNRCTIGFMNEIFPELKESEDEEIKEMLKVAVERTPWMQDKKEKCYEWLEKQGEQKPVDDLTQQEAMDIAVAKCFEWGEQKPTKVEPKFKVGQTIKKEGFNLEFTIVKIKNGFYYNNVGDHFPFTDQDNWELVEQNPTWSEEDENRINRLIAYFEDKESFTAEDDIVYANWLKSLKDRVQPQTKYEWSDEDEKFVHGLIRGLAAKRDIHGHTTFSSDCIDITETINWLVSLKYRMQPQTVWRSEDDEDLYTIANNFMPEPSWNAVIETKEEGSGAFAYDYNQMINMFYAGVNWLKSLRPQKQWKPSESDIRILEQVIDGTANPINYHATLHAILEKLKKLREE